jgi:hypothetical protein
MKALLGKATVTNWKGEGNTITDQREREREQRELGESE